MENKKDNKKLILIVLIILLVLGIVGGVVYFLLNRTSSPAYISVVNGASYPVFDENTSHYIIYTSESSLTFNCSGKKVANCSDPVPVSKGKSTYSITINDKTYTYSITKVDPNSSTLSIKSVRGNPTVWTNDATLTVTVENTGEVKTLEYTFDGGETWGSSNSARLTKNGIYKIQARDYFGFLSDVKTVEVTKVDTVAPTLEVSREIRGETEMILTAVAADSTSGIDSYSWSTGATMPSIVVNTAGTYTITVTDVAGNMARRSIAIRFGNDNEEELPDTSGSSSSSSSSSAGTSSGTTRPRSDDVRRGGDEDTTIIVRPTNPDPQTPEPVTPTNTFVALFVGNGATTGEARRSCDTTSSSCAVRTPSISRSGYEILGWSTHADARIAEFSINEQIDLSGNMILYAVTRRALSANYVLQDPDHLSTSSTSSGCTIYNEEYSCAIMLPSLSAMGGFVALGWNLAASSTSADFAENSMYNLPENTTFYSISRRESPIRALFSVLDENSATVSGGLTECNLYNGATECRMTAPELTALEGFTALGWHDPDDAENVVTLESGETFYLSIENDGKTFYAVTQSDSFLSATFILQDPAAGTLSRSVVSCQPEANASTCSVNVPTLELNSGYAHLGWSETADSTSASLTATTILLERNVTYYSVTKKIAPVTATFSIQDPSAATLVGEVSSDCELFNGAATCRVQAPSLTSNPGYEALGWNDNPTATSQAVEFNAFIDLASSKTFYSVTRTSGPIAANFRLQDTTISSLSGGSTSCYLYNGATSCYVTAPTLTTSGGHAALGWSRDRDATTGELASGGSVLISGGETFWAITEKSITITFHIASETSTHTCVLYHGEKECTFTFPELTNYGNYNFIGWNVEQNAETAQFASGDTHTVYDDTEYYAISHTVLTVLFVIQDSAATNSSQTTITCNLYNGATSCQATAPELTATSGYTAIGWNTDSSATTATLSPGASMTISQAETYYSITRKTSPVSINFVVVTPTYVTKSGGTTSCYLYNGATSCQLVAPNLTNTNSSYTVAGWGPDASGDATLAAGAAFRAGSSYTLYSISFRDYRIVFDKNTSFQNATPLTGYGSWYNSETNTANNIAASDLSFSYGSNCRSYNGSRCKIAEVPRIYSPGNIVLGWSPYAGEDVYYVGSMRLNPSAENTVLYARVWNWYSLDDFTLGTETKINVDSNNPKAYYPIEFQDTIDASVVSTASNYAQTAFTNVPALKTLYGKMRVSNRTTYNAYDGGEFEGSAGITYVGFGQFSPVDILSYYDNILVDYSKHAIIHELGHALDGAFRDKTGTFLHAYPEFVAARNELLAIRSAQSDSTPNASRPLSDYAFSDTETGDDGTVEGFEFLAEAFTAYYRDKFGGYADDSLGYTTDSLNSTIERYLCYAEHNYNLEYDCE